VNLDPQKAQETTIHWNYFFLGLDESSQSSFEVTDLLDGKSYTWGRDTFVRLDPSRPVGRVAHIAHVKLS
jgi:starch synthase (maltosyl-transferring)